MKKGISLIVLIITIIVMIILAGSIIISMSNDNVIDKAGTAKKKYSNSEIESAAKVAYASWLSVNYKYISTATDETVTDEVKSMLEGQGINLTGKKLTVTPQGAVTVSDGNVSGTVKLAKDLVVGDNVLVNSKIEEGIDFSNLQSEAYVKGIIFEDENGMFLMNSNDGVSENYVQISKFDNGSPVPPVYLCLKNNTTVLSVTVDNEGWYKTEDLQTVESVASNSISFTSKISSIDDMNEAQLSLLDQCFTFTVLSE